MSEWKPDPVLKEALSSGPQTFALIVLPLIERFGDEVKALVKDIMYREGVKKGLRLAAKAKDPNDLVEFERLLVEDYSAKGFNTPGFDDPAREWIVRSKTKCCYNLRKGGACEINVPAVWKEMGLNDEAIKLLGDLYCVPYDTGARKGFNPKIKFEFQKLATRGDPYCQWYEELE